MDIAGKLEKIFVGINDFCPEPLLKKVADKIIFGLKITNMAYKKSLDKFGNRQFSGLVEKEVEVAGHETLSEYFYLVF